MKKALKWVLIGVLVIVVLFAAFIVSVVMQTISYYSDEGVYGDVVLLTDEDIHVGDTIPMIFVVPEEYSDLHKEMWDCYMTENEDLIPKYEYVMERIEIQETYTKDEIKALFKDATISIYDNDILNSEYSSKIALFKPEEPGDYYIGIMGYYHSTSPQGYGGTYVTVKE